MAKAYNVFGLKDVRKNRYKAAQMFGIERTMCLIFQKTLSILVLITPSFVSIYVALVGGKKQKIYTHVKH